MFAARLVLALFLLPSPCAASEYLPDAGPWRTVERARVQASGGPVWLVRSEARQLGLLAGEHAAVPATLPRVRLDRIAGLDTVRTAVLLAHGNGGAVLLPPGTPAESDVPTSGAADAHGAWPNACAMALHDTTGALDVNGNGDPEIAVRRFCSCPARACTEILLVELRRAGEAALVEPRDLVAGVTIGEARIRAIEPRGDAARPRIVVEPVRLEGCDFIGETGLAGANDCPDCCLFPVLLEPLPSGGGYGPVYDEEIQRPWLDRARRDVDIAAAGDPASAPSVLQLGQLGRAAAFFYLTGNGRETRALLLAGMRDRWNDPAVTAYLEKLERIFLPRTASLH